MQIFKTAQHDEWEQGAFSRNIKKQKTFYPEDLTKYSILSYELI